MLNAENLIYDLPSIVGRIDLEKVFPKAQPLEVELGCGDGTFLAEYANQNPGKNFIGVERLLGRISKLNRKGMGLKNLRGVRIESSYFLEFLLPRNSVSALHIYFPDPWPKKRHHKNRLINEKFPALAKNTLSSGGKIYLRTDDKNYFQKMTEIFGANKNFREIEAPAGLSGLLTDFETEFNAKGIQTLRASYQLI
jgi:tRNA (guanine-N7-)-methyltransferase